MVMDKIILALLLSVLFCFYETKKQKLVPNPSSRHEEKENIKYSTLDSLHIFVLTGDSTITREKDMLQNGSTQVEITISNAWDTLGYNPWTYKDTTRYRQHTITSITIDKNGEIIYEYKNNTYYGKDDPKLSISHRSICHIYGDTIWKSSYTNKSGGMGWSEVYVKGYKISKNVGSLRGGVIFDKKTPWDSSDKPIGDKHYCYSYYENGRVKKITSCRDKGELIYSINYSPSGKWNSIRYKKLSIKRNIQ